jgi:aldehyde dehydrogenase (NAD+)
MNGIETATPVRAFNRAYINGEFVTPHGTQVVDLVNPTNNRVIGKVTMADEIDTRQAIGAAKEAFNTFSQSRTRSPVLLASSNCAPRRNCKSR